MIYYELHLQKLCPIFGGSSIMGSFCFGSVLGLYRYIILDLLTNG